MRVLIVDDDAVNRRLLAAMLETGGVPSLQVSGGHEALTLLDGTREIAAVLMDLRMPGMDGFEATRRIRSRNDHRADLPIAIITADTALDLEAKSIEAGADEFIRKPLNMGGIHRALGRLLTKASGGLVLC